MSTSSGPRAQASRHRSCKGLSQRPTCAPPRGYSRARVSILKQLNPIAPETHHGRRTGCARPHPRPRDGGSRPMPDLNGVTGFLLERGLIEPGAVVDGDLTVTSVPRRNRNFLVRSAGGSGYLIKQPGDPVAGGAETVRREAEFL